MTSPEYSSLNNTFSNCSFVNWSERLLFFCSLLFVGFYEVLGWPSCHFIALNQVCILFTYNLTLLLLVLWQQQKWCPIPYIVPYFWLGPIAALFKVLCYVGNRVPFWMQYCLNQQVAVSLRCVRAGQVRQIFAYTVLFQHQWQTTTPHPRGEGRCIYTG